MPQSLSSDQILDAVPDGVFVVDSAGRIRLANGQACALFGYEREELLAMEIGQLVPAETRPAHARHVADYFADAVPRPMGIGMELQARRSDGTLFPVEIGLSPVERGDGPPWVVASVRDVTQRLRLRDFRRGALRASEAERTRIARDLHDETAQQIAAHLIRLRLLENRVDHDLADRLATLREDLARTAEGLRGIARGLRPPELDEAGLGTAVRAHARALRESTGAPVRVEVPAGGPAVVPELGVVAYRIAQESLNNAVRHSGASEIVVRLREDAGGDVVLEVEDDGAGFDLGAVEREGSGLGLMGMRERAATVGATLVISTEPGEGTIVRLRLPVREVTGA